MFIEIFSCYVAYYDVHDGTPAFTIDLVRAGHRLRQDWMFNLVPTCCPLAQRILYLFYQITSLWMPLIDFESRITTIFIVYQIMVR